MVTENCGTDLGLEVWRICPPMDLWIIKCLRWWWSYMKYAQSNGYKFALLNKSLSSSTDSWLFSFSAKKIMFNSWGLTLKMSFAVLSILSTYCLSCYIHYFAQYFTLNLTVIVAPENTYFKENGLKLILIRNYTPGAYCSCYFWTLYISYVVLDKAKHFLQ